MAEIIQTGFQPSSTPGFENEDGGFNPQSGPGFENEDGGFNPRSGPGGRRGDTTFIADYYRGAMDAVPTGYDQGLRAGAAQAKGEPRDNASSTGFIDATESISYSQGYAQGLVQGYACGFAAGMKN